MSTRLALTVQSIIAKYPALPLADDASDFVWTAAGADFEQGFSFPATGRELLLVRNDNSAEQTITINSVADPYQRTGDIANYSLGAGEYAVFPPFPVDGWQQSDGSIHGAASAADVMLAVLRLPE